MNIKPEAMLRAVLGTMMAAGSAIALFGEILQLDGGRGFETGFAAVSTLALLWGLDNLFLAWRLNK